MPWLANLESSTRAPDPSSCAGGTGKTFLTRLLALELAGRGFAVVAEEVRQRAREVAKALKACENPRRLRPVLTAFDDELKTRGVNPGTSADLTVASVSVLLLQERLHKK